MSILSGPGRNQWVVLEPSQHDRVMGMNSTAPGIGTRQLPAARGQVILRPWQATDLEPYRHWLAPHQDWHRWDAPSLPPLEQSQIDSVVALVDGAVREHGGWLWPRTDDRPDPTVPAQRLVIADEHTDDLIGTVSWYWDSELALCPSMGIQIFDPAHRGLGRGAAALDLWITYLFSVTTWDRLDYATWSGNRAMMRVGQKLGFEVATRFPNTRVVDGVFYDSVVMAVLRSQWQGC